MRTVLERYYTQYYMLGEEQPSSKVEETEDHYVNQHTNGLAIIGVAPSHPVLKKEISKIEFQENSMNSEVSGIKKRGGFKLQKETIICKIYCSDNTQYNIRSCIKGKLLEINKNLTENDEKHNNVNFSLLKDNSSTSGFIAIVEPLIQAKFIENPGLISYDDYHKIRNIPVTKGPVFLKDTSLED
ncbi:hypothetical protein DICPUDRAFT_150882 [Dictyostelium purpureum]|uniref:Actin-binding transcription modulator n=1 Tax=Dictyostelium purpureum TaxID=5786 RepID=F0ZHH6_DICPU|nr:uncharacterized protein DICPUDRAFT_150882 [Dictyostelium purpureum]EGC36614.1 hypothetical protein DICPUDRAFT_150882 [Dictyostelium purpureum]|eukprot:XP_003286852.1 hypothetical protein DICPUDRAFT_150882 [Dictyostelium purpureum]